MENYKANFKCMKPILPLVYSEALSYMEVLAQVSERLNEVIDQLNNFSSEVLDEARAYTDSKVAEQLQIIEDAVAEVNRVANELRNDNQAFQNTVNARMNIVEYNFDRLKDKTEADYKASTNYTNLAIEANNEYLINNMQKELAKVKVLNYFTGEYVTIQDMFDYLAHFHLTNAISVATLIDRAKTVNQLIAYNMTMTDLATNGATIITN